MECHTEGKQANYRYLNIRNIMLSEKNRAQNNKTKLYFIFKA